FTFRGLTCRFNDTGMKDATAVPLTAPIYAPEDYSHSRQWGHELKRTGCPGLRYNSVRSPGNICWALMTPRPGTSIIQTGHYEMIWSNQIIGISRIATLESRWAGLQGWLVGSSHGVPDASFLLLALGECWLHRHKEEQSIA